MSRPISARVEELFSEARLLPEGERGGFLDRACPGEPDLRGEVESLLRSDAAAENVLERVVVGLAPDLPGTLMPTETPSAVALGQQLGPYRITELVGSGGMGFVFAAVRTEGRVEQRVAVKVVKAGIVDEDDAVRFLRERRALAQLDHPNVARFLDAGHTDEGRPYLVMEFVEGEAIDLWCDARRLPVAARLRLFRAVCAAVDHAHRNLVVHRDIKPSNVLVTADGEPKLLDFGIAKILGPQAEATLTTRLLLTPEYASPEQLQTQPISTASDVYSLGVVLYQLLTGRKPFESGTRPTHELARSICEDEPTRPSDVTAAPEEPARQRGCTPDRLRRQLSGDLDTIVLKALRKEPARRYASAEQLAEDIRRHLEGLPVLARKDTLRYRAWKFARRNRAGVLAAALVIASLGTGLVMTTRALAREREQAAHKERLLSTSFDFVERLPELDVGSNPHGMLVAMLDGAAASALELDFLDPVKQIEHLGGIARGYQRLGLGGPSRPFWAKIERLAGSVPGQELRRAEALTQLGRHEEALAVQRELLGGPHVEIARTLKLLARSRWSAGELQPALDHLADARAMLEQVDPSDMILAEFLAEESGYRKKHGEYDVALELLDRAIAIAEQHEPEDARLAAFLTSRGHTRQSTSRFEGAEDDLRAALAIYERVKADGHPTVTLAKYYLGLLYKDTGRFEDAEAVFRDTIAAWTEVYGHESEAQAGFGLGRLLADWGRWEEAEPFARAVANWARATKPGTGYLAERLTLAGRVLVHLDRPEQALDYLEPAHRLHTDLSPVELFERNKTASVLGHALAGLGRYEEAEALLLESVPRIRAARGDDHYRTAQALHRLVDLYEGWDMPDEAQRYRERITPAAREHRIVRATIGDLGSAATARR